MSRPNRIRALDLLLELTVSMNEDMTESLARDGLTPARAHLLWVLRHQGPSTQRELADALRVSGRNVTGLVDGLVATGFVTREAHPTDRRATLVTFTAQGSATADGLVQGQQQLADALFSRLPGGQLDHLVEALGTVADRLRRLRADAAAQQVMS
jgi:DNA-binding MarR family transcriptional regulator